MAIQMLDDHSQSCYASSIAGSKAIAAGPGWEEGHPYSFLSRYLVQYTSLSRYSSC